ncbi:MAG TPA: hypothetical protein VFZ26_17095 [Gemmatimonadales bacterium]
MPLHAAAFALLLAAAPSVSAQAIAFGEPPPIRALPDQLAGRYHVRLTSAWPQLPAGAGCVNGGVETVEGTLTRTGRSDYFGTLTRKTRLLFCGAHGAVGEPCALVLDGEGDVTMRGTLVADEHSPNGRALRVTWTPGAEHAARVTGACDPEFKEKVERMYLSVRHGAEFALPDAGTAPRRERLENYAWTVEVE